MASQVDEELSVDATSVDATSVDVDKLLFLVQNNPAIYDASMKEHYNVDIMGKISSDIGKELNVPGNLCKKKWTNLRGSYMRYVKELKKMPSGSQQQKKKWHLFDAMSFLQSCTGATRKMTGNLNISQNDTDSTSTSALDLDESQTGVGVEDDEESAVEKQASFHPKKKAKRTTAEQMSMVATPMAEYFKAVTEKSKANDAKMESSMLTFFLLKPKCLLLGGSACSKRQLCRNCIHC